MTDKSPIFEKTYRDYLSQVADLDLSDYDKRLSVTLLDAGVEIPMLGKVYRVTPAGIADENGNRPVHAVSVVLCRYLIMCPQDAPVGGTEWVSYRDFRDAAPFVGGFVNNTERAIEKNFSGRTRALEDACKSLGGYHSGDDLAYDLAMQVDALPRVPLYMLFNDADEEFPAQCRVLFQRRAQAYLDMECLAIIGWLFADYLMQVRGETYQTIM